MVATLKRLEAASGGRPTPELQAADQKLRAWPRTPQTDPYKAGLEDIARALERHLSCEVLPAYNEFCAPSLEKAFADAVAAGASDITVISTMYTRGGIHSESEIPEIMKALQAAHPGVAARYAWPFDLDAVAGFLAAEVQRAQSAAAAR
jgi:sirohydrochlorin cobaltochelatase